MFQIHLNEPLGQARRRVALAQVQRALRELQSLETHECIHQLRKRTKKIRALVRLLRSEDEAWYRRENDWFRDLAGEYAGPRDADVALDTCSGLLDEFRDQITPTAFEPILDALEHARAAAFENKDLSADHTALQLSLFKARQRVRDWPVKPIATDVLIDGFGKTYARGRSCLDAAQEDSSQAVWHQWRKRVKYHRYHWKLLQGIWPEIARAWRGELHRLSDLLGCDHDLNQLIDTLVTMDTESHQSRDLLIALARQRSDALRRAALPLGRRLFADDRRVVEGRLSAWLRADGAR